LFASALHWLTVLRPGMLAGLLTEYIVISTNDGQEFRLFGFKHRDATYQLLFRQRNIVCSGEKNHSDFYAGVLLSSPFARILPRCTVLP
jgi:hypothetical protein